MEANYFKILKASILMFYIDTRPPSIILKTDQIADSPITVISSQCFYLQKHACVRVANNHSTKPELLVTYQTRSHSQSNSAPLHKVLEFLTPSLSPRLSWRVGTDDGGIKWLREGWGEKKTNLERKKT